MSFTGARNGTTIAVKTCIGHHHVVVPPRNIEATVVELSWVLGGVLGSASTQSRSSWVDLETLFSMGNLSLQVVWTANIPTGVVTWLLHPEDSSQIPSRPASPWLWTRPIDLLPLHSWRTTRLSGQRASFLSKAFWNFEAQVPPCSVHHIDEAVDSYVELCSRM